MKELKRRFVYHMWVPDNIFESQKNIIKIHISCIKRFIEQFNDIIIVLAYDNNINATNKLKHIFLDLVKNDNQTISIKQVKNTSFREAPTAYEYLYSFNDIYDGITFFAHSKGLNNIIQSDIEEQDRTSNASDFKNISEWIAAMYYFNLNFKEEVNKSLSDISCYYGSLLIYDTKYNSWIYSGAFYWLNQENLFTVTRTVYKTFGFLKNTSKITAETMPNNLIPQLNFRFINTHNDYYLPIYNNNNSYTKIDHIIKETASSQKDYDDFMEFYNSILDEIKLYDIDFD